MSTFNYLNKNIYYEVHGTGKPLVMLNGIMMSTKSWLPFVKELSRYNQLILVDFLDQGQTDKMIGIDYKHDVQVELVEELCKHLGLQDICLFGISYGGEIAIQYALKYQHRINKLLLFNTTAKTSPWLEEVGNAWILASNNPENYYSTAIPVIYSPLFYEREISWMNKRKEVLLNVFSDTNFIQAMERLTKSSNGYNVVEEVENISVPTLIVSSEYDFVTPRNEQDILKEKIKDSSYVIIPSAGHASMYEQPNIFVSLILGFVLIEETRYNI